jgi:Tol biopolymer transport system component
VTALIEDLKSQPVANPPAYVASYEYSGQVVYYVPPRCCDIFGNLYDAQGQLICHPDGGIAGNGDGRCPDFLSQRKNETVLWRDTRSPA